MDLFKPKINIKFDSHPSVLKLASVVVGVFVTVFVLLFVIFNGPLIISLVNYRLTHSEQADNERLTAQYIALYGYRDQEQPSWAGQSVPVTQAAVHVPSLPVVHDNRITISKIGIAAPIIQVPSDNVITILNALKGGVVLYPGSAYPGQSGSTIIVGHSSSNPPWTKYSAIFSLLDKLAPNDLVNVSFDGKEYTYRVKSTEKGSVQHIINSNLGGDLILSSCWPVGTDQGRITVVADLVQ
ncbi:MAG: sortase [Candidatus Paceibacterota bacterium]